MLHLRPHLLLLFAALAFSLSACDSTDTDTESDLINAPDTYTFERDGASSVSYTGQTERLDMLAAMKDYLKRGDNGEVITEQALLDMFENAGGDGGGQFDFTSGKQLKDKAFAPDLDDRLFEDLFAAAAEASVAGNAGTDAEDGTAGLIVRENSGNTILLDARGREFTQLVEKGLMGSVFYNQIYNVYLTDDRIGEGVENDELAEGANYTPMEHHWDEAFGYWGAPVDFASNWPEEREDEDRFWAHYSNGSDDELGTNGAIMDAYIVGRTAIVNDDDAVKNAQRDALYEQHELVAAATAVHYINDTLGHLDEGNTGEAFHTLSEAWAFVNALRYSPRRAISLEQIDQIMDDDFGADGNFWNVTPAGLNAAKATLVGEYPDLAPVQDQL
jgi:hypothetical protein